MHDKNEKGSIGYDFRLNEKILKGVFFTMFLDIKLKTDLIYYNFMGKREW